MRRTNYLAFALILLLAGALSCKKEDTTTNTTTTNSTKTSKEILIASQWKKSQYKENGVVKPFFGSCEMDDVLSFSTDGNYTMNDGATKCSWTSPTDFYVIDADNKTMRWGLYGAGEISFNSDKTSFTFKRTGANTFEYIYVKY